MIVARIFVILCVALCVVGLETKERRDRFRLILSNVTGTQAKDEIDDFLNYGCEVLVSISNDAEYPMRLRCRSTDDAPKDARIAPGHSYLFTLRPLVDGTSDYWCVLSYRHLWARFDAYNEHAQSYLCPGNKVYRFSVKHDGVYAHPEKDGGQKIRALFKGHNEFSLWEDYHEESDSADGLLMKGFVDGGMCSDLPDHFDDKTEVINVCNHQCIFLYEHRGCTGPVQKVQAKEGCNFFPLDPALKKRVSAVKGC